MEIIKIATGCCFLYVNLFETAINSFYKWNQAQSSDQGEVS